MRVSIIAAVAENMVIGRDNDLIWDLPEDMAFFTRMTKGHVVIMGRRNYDSIPLKYRPLPGRTNVVVTHKAHFEAPGCVVVSSIEEGIAYAKGRGLDEVFVIGGGQIYKTALERKLVNRMYITWIKKEYAGDTYFPSFEEQSWEKTSISRHEIDARHEAPFDIYQYDLKK